MSSEPTIYLNSNFALLFQNVSAVFRMSHDSDSIISKKRKKEQPQLSGQSCLWQGMYRELEHCQFELKTCTVLGWRLVSAESLHCVILG